MILNNIPEYPTSLFTYDRETKRLVAEISDLGPGRVFGQIYDDACDEGLTLVNERTGNAVIFYCAAPICDREGELQVFVLKPLPRAIARNPRLAGVEIHLLND